jgi:hypothetical protein
MFEVLDPQGEFLRGRAHGGQFGECGLIDAVLEKVGVTNRFCFECGAADGVWLSNTKHLRDAGWSALLVECDDKQFDKLTLHASEHVRCYRQRVAGDDLDRLLARCGAPADLDLGVLDIDGDDVNVWDAMTAFRPRVMLVEYNPRPADPPPPPPGNTDQLKQAGLTAMVSLGRSKGYVPLCRTDVNVLFARADALASAAPALAG